LKLEAESTRMGIGEPCLVPWARHAVLAHTGAGRLADASRVLEWLERCAAALPCRWPRIAIATGRAALAEIVGNRVMAEQLLQEALRLHEGLELPIQKVETLHHYGAFLRRSGQPSRARSVLAEALRVAEDVGAGWLANHVHRELASAGGRRRRREEPERLTSQEQRVAELAAGGLTNKEIAQRLWLHVSTVESHLQQVYSKLGIRSRRQLMTSFVGPAASVPLPKVPGNPGGRGG
jgi:DNA-binding CsgD family transcriptional regulator